jgi:hypothetical protein
MTRGLNVDGIITHHPHRTAGMIRLAGGRIGQRKIVVVDAT